MDKTKLKQARIRAALSQPELAERAGLTPVTVCRAETGARTPALRTIRKLAEALGLAPHELMTEDGDGISDGHGV